MILAGCDAFARYAGPTRTEAELLPHCWEQISHKHVERRLLVAETCGVLAPSLPVRQRFVLYFYSCPSFDLLSFTTWIS